MKKINFDYLNLWKEIPIFCWFLIVKIFVGEPAQKSGNILIVNPSLVGEFAASVPAIRDYIQRNSDKTIDLIVSLPLKKLAQHIIGIRRVYTTASVFGRASEQTAVETRSFDAYEKTIVLRISPGAYRMIIGANTGIIKTALPHFLAYGFHLAIHLILGRTPKSWGTINFKMLGGVPRRISFNELFQFEQAEQEKAAAFPAIRTSQKKVIIHTGASWILNKWSNEKWVELLTKLHAFGDFRFIFVGADKDSIDYDFVASRLNFKIYSLIGIADWNNLLLVFRISDYFIGVDSGPRNLAHLADLPSITLLGPGPHMYTPPNPRDIVLDHSKGRGLSQRFVLTRKNHFMDKIQPNEVIKAFKKLTTRSGPGGD